MDQAIRTADLNLNPLVDGQLLRIAIPKLTEDRRKELIKVLKTIAEKEEELKKLDCAKKLEEYKQVAVKSTIDKYSSLDEERIQAEIKYQENLRIFMGASVLVLALTIILVNRK